MNLLRLVDAKGLVVVGIVTRDSKFEGPIAIPDSGLDGG